MHWSSELSINLLYSDCNFFKHMKNGFQNQSTLTLPSLNTFNSFSFFVFAVHQNFLSVKFILLRKTFVNSVDVVNFDFSSVIFEPCMFLTDTVK